MKKSYSKPEFEKIDLMAGEQILAATLENGQVPEVDDEDWDQE